MCWEREKKKREDRVKVERRNTMPVGSKKSWEGTTENEQRLRLRF